MFGKFETKTLWTIVIASGLLFILSPFVATPIGNIADSILLERFEASWAVSHDSSLAWQSLTLGENIFTVATIGGASIYAQTSALRRSPHFVVGTPGRLKDLLENRKLNLYVFNNIVLDEVDRMMDMGFINDIKFLLAKLPTNRQSLFFSATIPAQVAPLMQTFLKNPLTISVKTQETAEAVEQNVIKLNGRNKIDVLHDLLAQDDLKKVLVFGRTKWGMEKLAKILLQRGFRVAAIHGNKSQGQRQRALEQFKNSVS